MSSSSATWTCRCGRCIAQSTWHDMAPDTASRRDCHCQCHRLINYTSQQLGTVDTTDDTLAVNMRFDVGLVCHILFISLMSPRVDSPWRVCLRPGVHCRFRTHCAHPQTRAQASQVGAVWCPRRSIARTFIASTPSRASRAHAVSSAQVQAEQRTKRASTICVAPI